MERKYKGIFITIEGGEGSGKTTLIQGLEEILKKKGVQVLITREPGGTALGDRLRELLLAKQEMHINTLAELFLFLASRSQHLEEVILPALQRGEVVICDRFNDSTIAYQGKARGIGEEKVRSLCAMVCDGLTPDCTLLLDIDPAVGLERSKRVHKKESPLGASDRIEEETFDFHRKVREALLQEAKSSKHTLILDAASTKEKILSQAVALINKKLP